METMGVQAPVTDSNREYTLLAAFEQFRLGWDYCKAGQIVNVCQNMQQRRGYFAALAAGVDKKAE